MRVKKIREEILRSFKEKEWRDDFHMKIHRMNGVEST
jgi:hypothetical protein